MTNTKKMYGIGAVLIAIAALWLALSPYWTLSRMRNAVETKDAAALNGYIDYEALRANLKAQFAAAMTQQAAARGADPAKVAMAMAFAGPMIDGFVQPAVVTAMLANDKSAKSPFGNGGKIIGDKISVHRTGLTTFVVESDGKPGGPAFKMSGFGWKLVGIDMPTPPTAPKA